MFVMVSHTFCQKEDTLIWVWNTQSNAADFLVSVKEGVKKKLLKSGQADRLGRP